MLLLIVSLIAGVLAVLYATKWIRASFEWEHEVSRKFVHVLGAAAMATLPLVADRGALAVAALALAVLIPLLSRRDWFPAMVGAGRSSTGPALALVAFVLLLLSDVGVGAIAVAFFVTGFGDALACLSGRRWGRRRLGPETGRTWLGSGVMLATSVAIVAVYGVLSGWPVSVVIAVAISIGLAVTAVEGISASSLDNLAIPLVTAVSLELTRGWTPDRAAAHLLETLLAVAVVALAMRKRWVTVTGGLAVLAIGLLVFQAAGWQPVAVLLLFFAASSVLSRARPDRFVQDDAKHGRGTKQALAFGTVPALAAIGFGVSGVAAWMGVVVASVASAASDTFATEIGRRSSRAPVLITTLRPVAPGTSGGVSALGLAGAAAGSLLIAVSALALGLVGAGAALWITLLGFAASLLDSLLGATLQARYRCRHCGDAYEVPAVCCAQRAEHESGFVWMTNEAVNLCISVAAGGLYLMIGLLLW